MASKPTDKDLRKVTVSKATKSGAKDKRYGAPLREETQTKTAAAKVIAKGNKNRGASDDEIERASRVVGDDAIVGGLSDKVEGAAKETKAGRRAAAADFARDYAADAAKRGKGVTSRDARMKQREGLERELKGSAVVKKIRAENKSSEIAKKTEPFEPSIRANKDDEAKFRINTMSFINMPRGKAKEDARAQVGRIMKNKSLFEGHPAMGVGAHGGQLMHPCQTPGCDKLADYAKDAGVCPSCESRGSY